MRGIEWAAGLFEGEGCITHGLSKHTRANGEVRGYPQFRIFVGSTDLDVLEEFHRIVEVGSVWHWKKKKEKEHHKEMHMWQCSGQEAIDLCMKLMPYLMSRRRAKFIEELERFYDRKL